MNVAELRVGNWKNPVTDPPPIDKKEYLVVRGKTRYIMWYQSGNYIGRDEIFPAHLIDWWDFLPEIPKTA